MLIGVLGGLAREPVGLASSLFAMLLAFPAGWVLLGLARRARSTGRCSRPRRRLTVTWHRRPREHACPRPGPMRSCCRQPCPLAGGRTRVSPTTATCSPSATAGACSSPPTGGEDEVVLPLSVFEHNPNVDIAPGADRMHPLHVLVHQGVPGEHNLIAVAGTPAAAALCPAGIVND